MEEIEWRRGEQKRLAEAAGISPQYLSDLLHGRRRTSVDMAIRLSRASGVVRGPGRQIRVLWWLGLSE